MADQPWHELPPDIAAVLRPRLDELANQIIEAVRTVPAYSRPLRGPLGEGIRTGVRQALNHFLAEIEASGPVGRPDIHRDLGRGEMRAGRSLDALLSAYRTGAREAWRRFATIGADARLAPETLYLLAESVFAYIDVLSAEAAAGHALEQSAAAGEAQLRRRRLVRMLVRDPPVEPAAVEVVAGEAQWRLPRELAVLAVVGPERDAAVSHLPADAISETIGEIAVALLPDPDGPGRRSEVERAVLAAGATAGLGTTVEWTAAAVSFARARAALALADGLPDLVLARERSGDLLLRSDPVLAEELARERLAPLAQLPTGSRERLTETLRAWLAEQGRLTAVAGRLDIHPQTARYRLARLRELFGERLEDPAARLELQIALRFRELVG